MGKAGLNPGTKSPEPTSFTAPLASGSGGQAHSSPHFCLHLRSEAAKAQAGHFSVPATQLPLQWGWELGTMGPPPRRPRWEQGAWFYAQQCHHIAVCPAPSHMPSLSLHFPICSMGRAILALIHIIKQVSEGVVGWDEFSGLDS